MSSKNTSNSSLTVGPLIGQGSYGSVYKGEYKTLKVAIKKIHASHHSVNFDAIENEIHLLERLQCRHIIQFYGVVHQNDEVWLITDYAERGSLKRAIDNALLVGWEIKKRIAQDIAKGLAYIHHEGILHRDLKSANVLLTKSMEVKLCDFGLAIVKDLIEAPSANTLYGTVRWMAPELLNDRPQYSAKSDVYALGMVMWEMAAMCTVPFKRTFDPKAILAGYRERLPGGTPEDYRLWVVRCWHHDPLQRPEANDIDLVDDVLSARWRASITPSMISVTDSCPSMRSRESQASFGYDMSIGSSSTTLSSQDENGVDHELRDFYYLSRMAMCNVADAQFPLAEIYEKGNSYTTKDDEKAFTWYLRAANQGHIKAMLCISDMYATGRGTNQSDSEAAEWHRRANNQERSSLQDGAVDSPSNAQKRKNGSPWILSWPQKASSKERAEVEDDIANGQTTGSRHRKMTDKEIIMWMIDQGFSVIFSTIFYIDNQLCIPSNIQIKKAHFGDLIPNPQFLSNSTITPVCMPMSLILVDLAILCVQVKLSKRINHFRNKPLGTATCS